MKSSHLSVIQKSLSKKVATLIACCLLLYAMSLAAMSMIQDNRFEKGRMSWTMDSLVQQNLVSLGEALKAKDAKKIQEKLESLTASQEINFARIDQTETPISVGKSPREVKLERYYPLYSSNGQPVGRLLLQTDLVQIQKETIRLRIERRLPEFLMACLIGLGLFLVLHFSFFKPLQVVAFYLADLNPEKELSDLKVRRLKLRRGFDELDFLIEHINSLKDRVRGSHWALKEANSHLENRVEERTKTILEQRQKLEASARWSALGEMAGSIAHEINNPLAIIMGKSQLLLRHEISPQVRTSLDSIVKTTGRIAEIIQSLRILSRDASLDPFEYISLDVALKDAMGLSLERLRKRGIEVRLKGTLEQWEISCRRVQIAQILVNLINNSIDAIENHPEKWIEFQVSEDEGFLLLSVVDSGKGIAPEIREKIMTPFFTTKEIGKGTGLGLSLSRSIMNAHEGLLEIDFQAPQTTLRLAFRNYRSCTNSEKQAV